jgi:hypothetical protein
LLAAPTLADVQRFLDSDLKPGEAKLVGLVFTARGDIAFPQVVGVLDTFHYLFGPRLHFFFAGFSRYDGPDADQVAIPAPDGGPPWVYGAAQMVSMLTEVQEHSKYKWRGETDIVLCVAARDADGGHSYLTFSTALVLDVAEMLRDGTIKSVGKLFESISSVASARDATQLFAVQKQVAAFGSSVGQYVLERLPLNLGGALKQGLHYRIVDLAA